MASKTVARKATADFHGLIREEEDLLRLQREGGGGGEVDARLEGVRSRIKDMGGRRAYQDASRLNTRSFRTSRLVTSTLTRMGARPSSGQPLPRVLEIGAINPDMQRVRWLQTRAIDVLSTAPGVEERDAFTLVPPSLAGTGASADGPFDVVVCSMVLNCVPRAAARGRMLVMIRELLRCGSGALFAAAAPAAAPEHVTTHTASPEATAAPADEGAGRGLSVVAPTVSWQAGRGVAFVMLPRRCVDISAYTTTRTLEDACAACGLDAIGRRESPGIVCWCLRASDRLPRLGLRWTATGDAPGAVAGAERGEEGGGAPAYPLAPEGVPGPCCPAPRARMAASVTVVPSGDAAADAEFEARVRSRMAEPPRLVRRIAEAAKGKATSFAVCFKLG